MKLTLIQWLIQGIPESIAMFLLGFVLLESKMDIKKALIPGVIQALILYFVRLFPLPFGIHTIVAIISLSILLLCFTEARYSKALLISFFVFLVLGLSELAILPAVSHLIKMPLEVIFEQPLLFALVTLPQVFVLFVLAFLVDHFYNKRKKQNGKTVVG
jgi:hypothetical protein